MKRVNRSGSKNGERIDSVQPKLPLQEPVSPRRALIRKCMAAILLVGLAVIVVGLAVALTLFISALIVQPSAEDDGTEETAEPLELQLRRRYSPKATSPSVNATLRRQRLNLCVQSPRRESLSCVPRAFILGAEQASAHGVFRALRETEAILGPSVKEYAFYSRTERWLQGWELLGWMYRGGQQLISAHGMRLLDPSAEYLGSPFAAERIYLSVRDSARFVVMLRDPVDRALDQFFLERGLDSTAEDNFGYIKHQERVNVTLGEVLAEELAVLQLCAAGSVPVQSKKPASVEMNMGPMTMKDQKEMTDGVDGNEKVEDTEDVSKPPNGYGLPDGLHSVVGDCLDDCTQCHPTGTPHMVRRDGGILAKGLYLELLEPYLNLYGRENFYFVQFEELHSNPAKAVSILNEIAVFLDVPGMTEEEWGGALHISDSTTNLRRDMPAVDPELEQWLRDFYRLPNADLERVLGKELGWS